MPDGFTIAIASGKGGTGKTLPAARAVRARQQLLPILLITLLAWDRRFNTLTAMSKSRTDIYF